jgi:hypothetical protein
MDSKKEGFMILSEKLETVQYVTDAEGNRQAVLLALPVWEEILALVESLEEAGERRWDEQFATSQDLLAHLADEALAEYQADRTQDLDPHKLPQHSLQALMDDISDKAQARGLTPAIVECVLNAK